MSINVSPEELAKLTPADQRDLQAFIQNEGQKAQVQKSRSIHHTDIYWGTQNGYNSNHFFSHHLVAVHELAEVCFKKCITGSISSGKLASKEDTCIQNCVERFMDSNLAVLRHLETLRAGQ